MVMNFLSKYNIWGILFPKMSFLMRIFYQKKAKTAVGSLPTAFHTVPKARNRQNQNNKRVYPMTNQGFFLCHPERTRRIFAVSIEKRFFVTSFLRMTYKERFCCDSACSARILTSIATRALPYPCTPIGAGCSASGSFLTVCQRAEMFFRHAENAVGSLPTAFFSKIRR